MTPTIKAALARMRDNLRYDGSDTMALAAAYADEHPADYDEPITPDWLLSVGFKRGNDCYVYCGLYFEECSNGVWELAAERIRRCHVATRGQMRDLYRAFGIEIEEPRKD